LIDFFSKAEIPDDIRDQLFDSLKLYVSWRLENGMATRTHARSLPGKIFYHKTPLKRQIDAAALIRVPLNEPLKLPAAGKKQLVEVSRGMLCMLLRETDPVTYADEDGVEYFDMGRGISIALYPMKPGRRLPFDSYIGYMAFKNSMPVAYGGGWIFQQRSKIGVNVFEPYRGGESSYLFCQVLRLYHHRFSVSRFIVEPYQIGKKNLEGLKSGAFWFYYRMGFIPAKEGLKKLAEEEFEKILHQKGYRTSLDDMKRLADTNLELTVNPAGYHDHDVASLSELITKVIGEQFKGDRQKAIRDSVQRSKNFLKPKNFASWPATDRQSFINFSQLLQAMEYPGDWTEADKLKMLDFIRMKGTGNESRYIKAFQQHRKLNRLVEHVLSR
jgi:hypothetical protein